MRINILISLLILLTSIWTPLTPHPAQREGRLEKPVPDSGSKIYRDKDHSVYLNGRILTVRYSATGEACGLILPPPYFGPSPGGPEDQTPKAEREGSVLRLFMERTVYDVRLRPRPGVLAVYPDPGCSGDKIIVDKHRNLLHLYKKGRLVKVYRVSTGMKPEYTPEGKFTVINKQTLPPGFGEGRYGPRWLGIGVPRDKDLRSEKPDPRAPSGNKYGLHGTNEPESIGTYASGGCVRLDNKDILEVYNLVEIGTPVEIIR